MSHEWRALRVGHPCMAGIKVGVGFGNSGSSQCVPVRVEKGVSY